MRIKGWMGRADQTTKVKGMFVRPEQIAEVMRRHPGITRARLVVTRENEQDAMALHAETASASDDLAAAIAESLQVVLRAAEAACGSSHPARCRTTARSSRTSGR